MAARLIASRPLFTRVVHGDARARPGIPTADPGLIDFGLRRGSLEGPMSESHGLNPEYQSLLQRHRWQLDALRCALADSTHELREAEAVLVQLKELQRAARQGASAVSDRLDPLHMRAVVTYLAQLVERIEQQTRHRDQLITLCSLKRRDCAEAEAQLAAIEGHGGPVSLDSAEAPSSLATAMKSMAFADPPAPAGPAQPEARIIEMMLPGV